MPDGTLHKDIRLRLECESNKVVVTVPDSTVAKDLISKLPSIDAEQEWKILDRARGPIQNELDLEKPLAGQVQSGSVLTISWAGHAGQQAMSKAKAKAPKRASGGSTGMVNDLAGLTNPSKRRRGQMGARAESYGGGVEGLGGGLAEMVKGGAGGVEGRRLRAAFKRDIKSWI